MTLLARVKAKMGSLILCVISLTYIGAINLCVLCVFVVRSTRYSLGASHFCKSTNWDFYGETPLLKSGVVSDFTTQSQLLGGSTPKPPVGGEARPLSFYIEPVEMCRNVSKCVEVPLPNPGAH